MTQSPDDLDLHARPLRLDHDVAPPRWWLNDDPVGTAVMNALSLTFPEGERFFIQSVKRYSADLPPRLDAAVRVFTAQEGAHTREHLAFNDAIARSGYEIAGVEALTLKQIEVARSRPPLAQLAATVALEHFTASFAHVLLADPALLDGAPEGLKRLWSWHAIEEIEHKAVAYDVYMHAAGHLSPWRRWMLRRWAMALATLMFNRTINRGARLLLAQDGITGLRARWRVFHWIWLKPGLFRRIAGEYLAFYRPSFHPWQVDDRGLIAAAEAQLGA